MTQTMAKKLAIIRKQDKVRVVTPEFFLRCGYPKCVASEAEVVIKQYGNQIRQMIGEEAMRFGDSMFRKVCREIAYARLKNLGFGGRQRSIYTERREELQDNVFVVIDTKICKTGLYEAPSGGGYGYEDEWEPGYLRQEKTHKILVLGTNLTRDRKESKFTHITYLNDNLEIEATNVEKVHLAAISGF